MQAQARASKLLRWKLGRSTKVTRHTCPRCQSQYEGIGCLECGWVSDTSVACCGSEDLRLGKVAAA